MKTIHTFRLLMLGLILIGPVLVVNAQVGEDDLIIYYSFNSDTVSDADISDVSGNGNDGLIKGNDIASVSGMVGEALEFPGAATDYISVRQHEYVDPFPALTLAAWVKAPGRGHDFFVGSERILPFCCR